MVPPVTKPTSAVAGSPSRSSTQVPAISSTPVVPGVAKRIPVFWSQAATSQSAARAAGRVPPMTHPKNRPEGIAIRPGSMVSARRSTTSTGSVGPSGRSVPNALRMPSIPDCGGTFRSGSDVSQSSVCARARSNAGP